MDANQEQNIFSDDLLSTDEGYYSQSYMGVVVQTSPAREFVR